MSKKEITFDSCNELVSQFEAVVKNPVRERSSVYYTGVDLGTACVVLAVLDENFRPVAGAYRYADVVRDGMVVDYIGAIRIVRELKAELEEKLDTELLYAAAAIPPEPIHWTEAQSRMWYREPDLKSLPFLMNQRQQTQY